MHITVTTDASRLRGREAMQRGSQAFGEVLWVRGSENTNNKNNTTN